MPPNAAPSDGEAQPPSRRAGPRCSRQASASGLRSRGRAPPTGRSATIPAPRSRWAASRRRPRRAQAGERGEQQQRPPALVRVRAQARRPAERREPGQPAPASTCRPARAAGRGAPSTATTRPCAARALTVSCAATSATRGEHAARPPATAAPKASEPAGRARRAPRAGRRPSSRPARGSRPAARSAPRPRRRARGRPWPSATSSARPLLLGARVADDQEDAHQAGDEGGPASSSFAVMRADV